MYNPILFESPKEVILHLITGFFHPTIALIGPAIVVGVAIVGVVLVGALIWYAILSWQGHRLEKPGVEE